LPRAKKPQIAQATLNPSCGLGVRAGVYLSKSLLITHKLPLTVWFLAIQLVTQAKTALSALALMRQIGVSYNTAWSLKHKIMQAMKERDNRKPLTGIIQLDDLYCSGDAQQHQKKRADGQRGSRTRLPLTLLVL
jgi:hypothetical protein